jgi:hypothetical protein
MSEIPTQEKQFSRPLRIDDLLDGINPVQNNYSNRNNRHNTHNTIEKNQQEFGNRKRIKP